jgi:hypothetical protein
MTFNTEVIGCYWQEEKGEWKVKLRQQVAGQEPREFEEHCHLLLYGAGVLNNFKVSPLAAYCCIAVISESKGHRV